MCRACQVWLTCAMTDFSCKWDWKVVWGIWAEKCRDLTHILNGLLYILFFQNILLGTGIEIRKAVQKVFHEYRWVKDNRGSDQSSGSSSGEECSAYILKVESIRFTKQKMRKREKSHSSLAWGIGRVELPFTEMEEIREGKACLPVCLGRWWESGIHFGTC